MEFLSQIFQSPPKFIKIGFEDIKYIQTLSSSYSSSSEYIMINTMPIDFQTNIIAMTIPVINEESIINRLIDQYEMKRIKIILYGLSATDYSVDRKAKQLQSLGFTDIYIYSGGMFEWLLLQELYGFAEFPTTVKTVSFTDIIKYRPNKVLGILRLI